MNSTIIKNRVICVNITHAMSSVKLKAVKYAQYVICEIKNKICVMNEKNTMLVT